MNPLRNLKSWQFNTTTILASTQKSQKKKKKPNLISRIKSSYFKNWWISQIKIRSIPILSDVNNKHCYVDICAVRVTAWQSKTSIVYFITRCHFKSMYYDIECHFIFHIFIGAGAMVPFLFFFSRDLNINTDTDIHPLRHNIRCTLQRASDSFIRTYKA